MKLFYLIWIKNKINSDCINSSTKKNIPGISNAKSLSYLILDNRTNLINIIRLSVFLTSKFSNMYLFEN